jgi:hypothetical protein
MKINWKMTAKITDHSSLSASLDLKSKLYSIFHKEYPGSHDVQDPITSTSLGLFISSGTIISWSD